MKLAIALVLGAVAAVLAHMHVVAQSYYPVVRVETPEGLTFTAVHAATPLRRDCGKANDRFLAPFKSMCEECRVVLARCERELDGLAAALDENESVPYHRIVAPGLRVAIAGPTDMARAGCQYIAKGLEARGLRSIYCAPPQKGV